jgi:hypothetical protein
MEGHSAKNNNEFLINFLHQDASLQLNWAQKKEVAVWSATIFYIGIVYFLFQIFLANNSGTIYQNHIIIIVIINVLILIAVTYFIWSNFNSIYNSNAYYLGVKKIIFDIFNKSELPSLENNNPNYQVHPNVLEDELQSRLLSIQPFNKLKSRPFIIVFSFWINFILPERFKINIGKHLAIQETVLYSLVFFTTFIFWFLVLIKNIIYSKELIK